MELSQLNPASSIPAVALTASVPTGLAAPVQAPSGIRLTELATGAEARVVMNSAGDSNTPAEVCRRLEELGFLPGERLRIVARGFLGREPLAVRIGTGTFALRLFEAACIRVCPEQP
jgi:ferrous iron transport protein A